MSEYTLECVYCDESRSGRTRTLLRWWTVHCMTHQWWWKAGRMLANAARRLKRVIT